jgi:hypothetical protein
MPASAAYPRVSRRHLILAAGLAPAAALIAAPANAATSATSADSVVLDWYDLTARAVAAAAYPEPITQSRVWAVGWLAAARAVAGQAPRYAVAALASALHDSLVALSPGFASTLDTALAATLGTLPDDGRTARAVAAGQHHAAAVLAERAGDGLDTASVDIAWTPPPAGAGVWQPTPPSFGPAVRAGQGSARPFLLPAGDALRPGPPPTLTSSTYRDALAEVRAVGSATSATRTAEQTSVALFWAQNSIDAYVQVLRAVLADRPRPVAEAARLVAAFHTITIDAQIAIYDAKYAYTFWRPVTAIRAGATDADPSWTPLINTPRHPEYPSGHGGYAGAAQRLLEELAGPAPHAGVNVSSTTAPGANRTYHDWASITQENVDGRVWEGIHFRFSDLSGVQLGGRVAEYGLRRLSRLGW